MRLPVLLCALSLSAGLALAGCGGDDEGDGDSGEQASTQTQTERAPVEPSCTKVRKPEPKGEQNLRRPTLKLDPDKTWTAVVTTNCGAFTITLDVQRSPKTSASFVHLARRKFFDGLSFHRIVPGFVVQGGDPQGNGQGGPGYSVTEAPPQSVTYGRGTVAMAKTETEAPGTSGSQFFIVTAEDAGLPPDYAVLGRVTKGQAVVDKIGVLPTRADESPRDPVVIRSVKIEDT